MTHPALTSKCANGHCTHGGLTRPGMLACLPCWNALPKPLRTAINEGWRKRASNGLAAYSENVLEARRLWAVAAGKVNIHGAASMPLFEGGE